MYAHKVIDDFNKIIFNNNIQQTEESLLFKKRANDEINRIKQSIKFYIDDVDGLYDLFRKQYFGKRAFLNDLSKYQKMPYDMIYVDWDRGKYVDKSIIPLYESYTSDSSRRSVLSQKLSDNMFVIRFISYFDNLKTWIPSQYSLVVSVGKNFGETEEGCLFIDNFFKDVSYAQKEEAISHYKKYENLIPIPSGLLIKESLKNKNIIKCLHGLMKEDQGEVTAFGYFLALLNSKNIISDKHYPPQALNKKRLRQGKQPLFTYHTLVVKPMSNKAQHNGEHEPTGIKQRLHFCRGHFKEYTESNKLFGRHTGLYWWQPMVRGNKELGIVHKDYEVVVLN